MLDKIMHNGIHEQDIVSEAATDLRIRDTSTSCNLVEGSYHDQS